MPVTMTLRKNLKPHTCTHTHQQVAYQLTTSEKQIRQSKKTKPPYSCPYFLQNTDQFSKFFHWYTPQETEKPHSSKHCGAFREE